MNPEPVPPPPTPTESDSLIGVRGAYNNAVALETRTLRQLADDPSLADGISWLVEDTIPLAALTLLYGIGKGGKTTLLSHLAAAVVAGKPFLERDVRPSPVLWIDLEQNSALTKKTLEDAGVAESADQIHVYNGLPPKVESIGARIEETKSALVVIDSVSRLFGFRDENDAAEVTKAMSKLVTLAHSTGAAVVAIHHDRKREGVGGRNIRGSSAFLATIDLGIALKVDGHPADGNRTLEFVGRYSPPNGTSISVRLTSVGFEVLGDRQRVKTDQLLALTRTGPLTAEEIADQLGVTRPAVLPALIRAVSKGQLERLGAGKRGDPFLFRVAVSPPTPSDLRVSG